MSASAASYYEILGLSTAAAATQINTAFRKLALKWHPDKAGQTADAHEIFIAIRAAFEVLSDSDLRTEYDISLRNQGGKDPRKRARMSPDSSPVRANFNPTGRKPFQTYVETSEKLQKGVTDFIELGSAFATLSEELKEYFGQNDRAVWHDLMRVTHMIAGRKARLGKLQSLLSQIVEPAWRNNMNCRFLARTIDKALASVASVQELRGNMDACVEKLADETRRKEHRSRDKRELRKKLGQWVLCETDRLNRQEKVKMSKWFKNAAEKKTMYKDEDSDGDEAKDNVAPEGEVATDSDEDRPDKFWKRMGKMLT